MLPIVANITTPVQAPASLVATPLPDTTALRPPTHAVPPSFSNPVVNNNARGNRQWAGRIDPPEPQPALPIQADAEFIETQGAQPTLRAVVSAPFLAQLIGQPPLAALQGTLSGVLDGYAQIVVRGLVKYKPSFASYPRPETENAFAQALAQQKPLPTPAEPTTEPPLPVAREEEPAAEEPIPIAVNDNVQSRDDLQAAPAYFARAATAAYENTVVQSRGTEPLTLRRAA